MIGRRLPAVAPPISITAVARALVSSVAASDALPARARALVQERFAASAVVPTDSGTSALVLALRLAVPSGGVVGYPGFACVDLAAAARLAGVRVRLYDLDPASLGPDPDSVDAMLRRGVDAIVVSHLFGYPADVVAVRERATRAGIPVVEDAAQGAGGTLHGRRLGTLGDLSVLSFGRGKGLCGGGGGALLAHSPRWAGRLQQITLSAPGRGWSGLAATAAQWALGRPSLYAIPSMLPWLHLGEMVHHEAAEPSSLPLGASALLSSALGAESSDLASRRHCASHYDVMVAQVSGLAASAPIHGGHPGYLRYAVRDLDGGRQPDAALGILRSYPLTLAEQRELHPMLISGEPALPGARELSRALFTLPTHAFVDGSDRARIATWMRAAPRARPASARARHGGA